MVFTITDVKGDDVTHLKEAVKSKTNATNANSP